MKSYNAIGWSTLAVQALAAALLAPAWMGPWKGMAVGMGYLVVSWFVCGLYLSDIIHMGIAHRALDYKEWFIKAVTLVNNVFGIYVDPVSWVNRHRLHHRFSDHDGDPNKLDEDGFWKTMWLCVFPYPCNANVATDAILQTWPFRLVSHPLFTYVSPIFSAGLLYMYTRDLRYTVAVWLGVRVFAMWVNMIQNYWTHTRRFGTRRYLDEHDNAMNIGEWFPVTATFSACWQNNHHHFSHYSRLSHDRKEYDFGFQTVRVMHALGLVVPSATGRVQPKDAALAELGF